MFKKIFFLIFGFYTISQASSLDDEGEHVEVSPLSVSQVSDVYQEINRRARQLCTLYSKDLPSIRETLPEFFDTNLINSPQVVPSFFGFMSIQQGSGQLYGSNDSIVSEINEVIEESPSKKRVLPPLEQPYSPDISPGNKKQCIQFLLDDDDSQKNTNSCPRLLNPAQEKIMEIIRKDLKEKSKSNSFFYRQINLEEFKDKVSIAIHTAWIFTQIKQNVLFLTLGDTDHETYTKEFRDAFKNQEIYIQSSKAYSNSCTDEKNDVVKGYSLGKPLILISMKTLFNQKYFNVPNVGLIIIDEYKNVNKTTHQKIKSFFSNTYVLWLKSDLSTRRKQYIKDNE